MVFTPPHLALETGSGVSQFLFLWLVVRAFAAGCTALTGIEAISDGVAAFKIVSFGGNDRHSTRFNNTI